MRLKVFDRDGWACVKCGKKGRLESDHVVPLEDGGAVYDLGNLQTLCRGCHIQKTLGERMGEGTAQDVKEWQVYLTRSGQ